MTKNMPGRQNQRKLQHSDEWRLGVSGACNRVEDQSQAKQFPFRLNSTLHYGENLFETGIATEILEDMKRSLGTSS